ncbi:hypothetical protein Ami103574_09375 [Aminipila butyrica]|uniref:Uncharacterized protein n=1 Tax=Aminipila butyrica TaxID=433296 RepID=A0A858BVA6_9FIRM|nr:hypothetical protein [Aminipila butyrica]QIB69527.1 hypothetical protein Ami103574_09375 [Aminipila butyrica]
MSDFKREFFRIYDKKIASGQLTFSQLGISKADFTSLCTEEEFSFSEEKLAGLCRGMKLDQEEEARLRNSVKKA